MSLEKLNEANRISNLIEQKNRQLEKIKTMTGIHFVRSSSGYKDDVLMTFQVKPDEENDDSLVLNFVKDVVKKLEDSLKYLEKQFAEI